MLIGITGKARSGKNTVADLIRKEVPRTFQLQAFADPIKRMLSELGLTHEQLDGRLKEAVDSRFGVTPRQMMQTLGTEWGRQMVNPDIWVTVQNRQHFLPTIFTDVRHENEARFIRGHEGLIVHVIGRGGISGDHGSEQGIFAKDADYVIENRSSLSDLQEQVRILARRRIDAVVRATEAN